jgi:hypothetical protein
MKILLNAIIYFSAAFLIIYVLACIYEGSFNIVTFQESTRFKMTIWTCALTIIFGILIAATPKKQ